LIIDSDVYGVDIDEEESEMVTDEEDTDEGDKPTEEEPDLEDHTGDEAQTEE